MVYSIANKAEVLGILRRYLSFTQVVLTHSRSCGEPPEMQRESEANERALTEAIRFIEEHAE